MEAQTLTLQETQSIHESMNRPKIEFITSIYIWASAWDFQQYGMCDQQSLRSACA